MSIPMGINGFCVFTRVKINHDLAWAILHKCMHSNMPNVSPIGPLKPNNRSVDLKVVTGGGFAELPPSLSNYWESVRRKQNPVRLWLK